MTSCKICTNQHDKLVKYRMSKRKTPASSQVPNTGKKTKAQGRRPSAFICFEVFRTSDEVQSPHVFSKEIIRNYAVTCVLKINQ